MPANGRAGRSNNALAAKLVTSLDQLPALFAIRAMWMDKDEECLSYMQAYDANDLQSTHVLLWDGETPVGAVRVRWFREFAKAERFVIAKAFRSPESSRVLVDFVFRHVAQKGYGELIAHATPAIARMWCIFYGFRRNEQKPAAIYNGRHYVEVVKDLAVPLDAVTSQSDINTLYRMEGAWHEASRYEIAS